MVRSNMEFSIPHENPNSQSNQLRSMEAAHPPILICWQHGLACALAWQELWLKVIYGPLRK